MCDQKRKYRKQMELFNCLKVFGIAVAVIGIIHLPNECLTDSVNYVQLNRNWTLINQNACKWLFTINVRIR